MAASPQTPPLALNLLCVWFCAQLFFTEKTKFTGLAALSTIRPDRLVFAGLLLYLLVSRRDYLARRRFAGIELVMLGFFGVLLASCLTSGATPLSYHFSTVVSFAGYPMVTFWLCRRLPSSATNLRRLSAVFVAIGAYLGLCGICEHYDWPLFIFPSYVFDPDIGIHFGRARGPFVQAEAFGGVLCVTAAMTAWYLTNVKRSIAAGLALVLMVAGIYFSYTRAVWLDLAIVIGALLLMPNRSRKWASRIALIVTLAALSGLSSKFSLYEPTLFSRRAEAAYARVLLANASLDMVQQRPWLGTGYGTFTAAVDDYLSDEGLRLVLGEGNHNTILGLLVEVGVVGAIPYLLILALFARQGVRLFRAGKAQPSARDLAVVALAVLAGFVCLAQFGDVRFFALFNSLLFALFGVVFAWTDELSESRAPVQRRFR